MSSVPNSLARKVANMNYKDGMAEHVRTPFVTYGGEIVDLKAPSGFPGGNCKTARRTGEVYHYKGGFLVRRTIGYWGVFKNHPNGVKFRDHPNYGETAHYESGKHVRTTFDSDHPRHGEVDHIFCDSAYDTTYELGHPRHGYVDHWEGGKHVRITFSKNHRCNGETWHLKSDTLVRKTFDFGKVEHYENERHVRTTFESCHPLHGLVKHFQHSKSNYPTHVRTSYESFHPKHGIEHEDEMDAEEEVMRLYVCKRKREEDESDCWSHDDFGGEDSDDDEAQMVKLEGDIKRRKKVLREALRETKRHEKALKDAFLKEISKAKRVLAA